MNLFCKKLIYMFVFSALLLAACGDEGNREDQTEEQAEPTEERAAVSSISFDDLMRASLNGELEMVRQAAEQDIELDQSDGQGRTPLMLAAFNGHTDVVKFLLDEGADVNNTNSEGRSPLIFAASGPNPETVELLLERGADPDVKDDVQEWTALMFAAAEGQAAVARTLLERGADPSLEDEDGETALDFARDSGHTEVVQLLERH